MGGTRSFMTICTLIVVLTGVRFRGVEASSRGLQDIIQNESSTGRQRSLLSNGFSAKLQFIHPDCGWGIVIEDYPYVTSIQLRNPVGTAFWHQCGGIQLTNRAILTTGTCVWPFRDVHTEDYQNHTGTLIENMYASISPNCRHQRGYQRIKLTKYFVHPDFEYGTKFGNDIAVVQLSDESQSYIEGEEGLFVSYSNKLDPNFPSWEDIVTRNLTTIGYGQKDEADEMTALNKPYFTSMLPHDIEKIRIMSSEECLEDLAAQNVTMDMEDVLCGSVLEGDLCQGDGGNPIIMKENDGHEVVVGLFSVASIKQCGSTNQSSPIFFTNVTRYQDWITSVLEELHADDIPWSSVEEIVPPSPEPVPVILNEDVPDEKVEENKSVRDRSFPVAAMAVPLALVGVLVLVCGTALCWCLRKQRRNYREQFYGSYVSDYTSHHLAVRVDDTNDTQDHLKTFTETFTSAFQQQSESNDFIHQSGRREGSTLRQPLLLNVQPDAATFSLTSITYPCDLNLMTASLRSQAVMGALTNQDNHKLLPFVPDLVNSTRLEENAIIAHPPFSQQHACVQRQPEYQNYAVVQLSDILVRSTVHPTHIRKVQSSMYHSLLQSVGQKRAASESISETSDLLFPQAAFGFVKDIVENDRAEPQQQQTQQKQQKTIQQQQLQLPLNHLKNKGGWQQQKGEEKQEALKTARSADTLQKVRWELDQCGLYVDLYRDIMLSKRLGGGSFGFVYEGLWTRNKGDQLPVAVKIMKTGHSDTPSWQLYSKQFMSEINMMASIRSDYVVRLYGGSITRDELAIVMELMEGGSLDHHIRRRHNGKPLPYKETLIIGMQIAKGLSELHPTVVHRDLKPQNILLNSKGDVKIADLGLSKMKYATYMTASEMKGTPAYIAPEVFGGKDVSEKCDIYALGMILWECVTGDKPWSCYQHPAQIMHEVMLRHNRPHVPKSCPEAVRSVIEKCWEHEPYRRLSAYEVGTRLQRELERVEGQLLPPHLNLFPQATRSTSVDRVGNPLQGLLRAFQLQRQMSRDDSAQGNNSRQNSAPLKEQLSVDQAKIRRNSDENGQTKFITIELPNANVNITHTQKNQVPIQG